MPALTGQCKRCLRFGELFPVRGTYYCRACGDVFEKHLRGYHGPERRLGTASPHEEPIRRRWSDSPAGTSTPELFSPPRPIG